MYTAAEARENKKDRQMYQSVRFVQFCTYIGAETYGTFGPLGLKFTKQIGVHKFSCNQKNVLGGIFSIESND